MLLLFVLFMGVVYGAFTATGSDRVDMTGNIVGLCDNGVQGDSQSIDSVLVEGFQGGASQSQNMSLIITKNTTVYHKYGKNLVKVSTNDLHTGQRVEIRFDGPVQLSYPPQVNAGALIILY